MSIFIESKLLQNTDVFLNVLSFLGPLAISSVYQTCHSAKQLIKDNDGVWNSSAQLLSFGTLHYSQQATISQHQFCQNLNISMAGLWKVNGIFHVTRHERNSEFITDAYEYVMEFLDDDNLFPMPFRNIPGCFQGRCHDPPMTISGRRVGMMVTFEQALVDSNGRNVCSGMLHVDEHGTRFMSGMWMQYCELDGRSLPYCSGTFRAELLPPAPTNPASPQSTVTTEGAATVPEEASELQQQQQQQRSIQEVLADTSLAMMAADEYQAIVEVEDQEGETAHLIDNVRQNAIINFGQALQDMIAAGGEQDLDEHQLQQVLGQINLTINHLQEEEGESDEGAESLQPEQDPESLEEEEDEERLEF